MHLTILAASIVLLLLLIARWKVPAAAALLGVACCAGIANGMAAGATLLAVVRGVTETFTGMGIVVLAGAVLGRIVEESGAARVITRSLVALSGPGRIQWAMVFAGLVVGLPMVYNASFLVLIPLVYTLASATRLPLLYLGIPLSAALSTAHGYLPPHPAPSAIAGIYGANPGLTLLYGLLLSVPAAALAGPLFSRMSRGVQANPPRHLFADRTLAPGFREPSAAISFGAVLLPVLLMTAGSVVAMLPGPAAAAAMPFTGSLGRADVALAVSAAAAAVALPMWRRDSLAATGGIAWRGVRSVVPVLLVILAGGAFKEVLTASGTAESMRDFAASLHWPPLIAAWCAAALLRAAVGSATVAAIMAGGVMAAVAGTAGVRPELLVIATTSGSLMFSHFNDAGFWMFREYYGVSVRDTFRIWTVMESIVAIVGLGGALLLNAAFPVSEVRAATAPTRGGIFYVNSYHEGYPSSDATMAVIRERCAKAGIRLRVAFLDGKRDPDAQRLGRRAAAIAEDVRQFAPAVLVASDDDAVREVVVRYFRNGPLPVVYAGVNWSAAAYGLPRDHITGVTEIVPIEALLAEVQRQRPGTRSVAVVSENSAAEARNREVLVPLLVARGYSASYRTADTFMQWKQAFAEAARSADVIYLPTNGAIRGWDPVAAQEWVSRVARVPVVTADAFMMRYAALGYAKVEREQGELAMSAALKILRGTSPRVITPVANAGVECFFNSAFLDDSGLRVPKARRCRAWQGND